MGDATPAVPAPDGPPPVPGVEIFDADEVAAAEGAHVPASTGPQLAHPALRALAFAMDGIGTVIVTVIVVSAGLSASYGLAFVAILVVPLLSAVLSTVLTAFFGVTPSKAIVGIKVVDAVSGGLIGWRSILRSLVIVAPLVVIVLVGWATAYLPYELTAWFMSTAVPLLIPIGFWIALLVVLAVRPDHRGLQDLAGRSVVVRR